MITRALVLAAGLLLIAQSGQSQTAPSLEELQKENEALRGENTQIRGYMDGMRKRMDDFEKSLSDKMDRSRYEEETKAMLKQIQASQPTTQQWVSTVATDTKLKIYGFLRADFVHDTRRTAGGYNSGGVVVADDATGKNGDTNITARNSRLGFELIFPAYRGIETSGKLEFDFGTGMTTGNAEISATPRLRLAYIQAKTRFATFLAGQTWDVFNPLNPSTDDVDGLWNGGGNTGYRRPQLRVEREFELAKGHKLLGQLALARAIGSDTFGTSATGSDKLDDGSAEGWPDLQGRTAYSTKLLTKRDTTVGVSGIYGQRKVDAVFTQGGKPVEFTQEYAAYGVGMDLTLPLLDKLFRDSDQLSFRTEWYAGQGLGGYLGHIGQFYNETRRVPMAGKGGWGELDYQLTKDLIFRGGWGMDCVDDDRLTAGKANANRERNTMSFLNFSYNITPNLVWTVEYEYLRTWYFESNAFDDNRVSTSFTLRF